MPSSCLQLVPSYICDVLVIGSGLAGACAALSARQQGAEVMLLSEGSTFSGSSFSGDTWGLGTIGPQDAADAQDLEDTILKVGSGVADPTLVHTLVSQIRPTWGWLEQADFHLCHPQSPEQQEYIPCFDHTVREWRGIERDSFKQGFATQFDKLHLTCLPHRLLVDLICEDHRIEGAIVFDTHRKRLELIAAPAIVLATGGVAGLYGHHLGSDTQRGIAHVLAHKAGAHLVNLESIQLMEGFVAPKKNLVFSEKTFRYLSLDTESGKQLSQELLEQRSTHGPISARTGDSEVDKVIAKEGKHGCLGHYANLPAQLPELDAHYFQWLKETTGITTSDRFRLGIYAHAENGGILIDSYASTGVDGLYAAGECTGGMHGVDRLGGLSSANCMVFGRIAGMNAATWAQKHRTDNRLSYESPMYCYPKASTALPLIQDNLDRYALLNRNREGLQICMSSFTDLWDQLNAKQVTTDNIEEVVETRIAYLELTCAIFLVSTMDKRTSDFGAHIIPDK